LAVILLLLGGSFPPVLFAGDILRMVFYMIAGSTCLCFAGATPRRSGRTGSGDILLYPSCLFWLRRYCFTSLSGTISEFGHRPAGDSGGDTYFLRFFTKTTDGCLKFCH
jgi:hypothetical protein